MDCLPGDVSSLATCEIDAGRANVLAAAHRACGNPRKNALALLLIQGKKVGPGLDLGLPGYRNLKRIADSPHGLAGDSWIAIDKSNAKQYPF